MRFQVSILGSTDSEHIAALFFYNLCGENGDWEELYPVEDMAKAMSKTISQLEEMKDAAERKYGIAPEHNALNLLCSSGASLVAIRYASPAEREPPSLYWSTSAGPTLNRKFQGHPNGPTHGKKDGKSHGEHGTHVILASEPCTYIPDEWDLIERNTMATVGDDLKLSFRPI
jgi:glutamine amidotransferase